MLPLRCRNIVTPESVFTMQYHWLRLRRGLKRHKNDIKWGGSCQRFPRKWESAFPLVFFALMLLQKQNDGLIERWLIDQLSDVRSDLFIVCLYHRVSSTREEKTYLYFSSRLYYNLKDFFFLFCLNCGFPCICVQYVLGHWWPKETYNPKGMHC